MQWVCPQLFKSWTLKLIEYAYMSPIAKWNHAMHGTLETGWSMIQHKCRACETKIFGSARDCYTCNLKNRGLFRTVQHEEEEEERQSRSAADEWYRKMVMWICFIHPRLLYYTHSCNSIERDQLQCRGCGSWGGKAQRCIKCVRIVACDAVWCKENRCSACNFLVCWECSSMCRVPNPNNDGTYCKSLTCHACYNIYGCSFAHEDKYCYAHKLQYKLVILHGKAEGFIFDRGLHRLCVATPGVPSSGCYEFALKSSIYAGEPKKRKIEYEK